MHDSSSRRRPALSAIIGAVIFSLAVPLCAPFAASAQDAQDQDGSAIPAATSGVARISALSGDVAVQRGDSNETIAAVLNAPVLGADYITTGPNARAEVGFDGHAVVRIGSNVQMRFSKVDDGDRQLQLASGTIDMRLFGGVDGQTTIDTPSISVVPRTSGSVRVSVDENGQTAVTVRAGRVDIETPQGAQSLEPGTTIVADGAASNPNIQSRDAIALDDFDAYNRDRDQVVQVAQNDSPYVNTDIQGVGDLNGNGNWVDDSTNGHVWIPTNVAADWAPYRDGNWVWEDGYGWTWVGAESWGWAPYHYGRWYFSTAYHHWAWYPPAPGRFAPAWSPALVGFVGFNIGAVNIGIGFGNIGWVPLAPHEAFHPWWGAGARNTYINNTTIVNNYHYRNLEVNHAMTAVTRENFEAGRFGHAVGYSSEQVRSFNTVAMRGALPIVPTAANLRFTDRTPNANLSVRASFGQRSFAGAGSVATRTPFVQQQATVSRVTHVAYRPASIISAPERFGGQSAPSYNERNVNAERGSAAPSYARSADGSWSRFNANRGQDVNRSDDRSSGTQRSAQSTAPSYARPQSGYSNGGYDRSSGYDRSNGYDRSANGYARPAQTQTGGTQSYARPQYARPPASGDYGYGRAPQSYDRPSYQQRSQGAYDRPQATYRAPQANASRPTYSRPAGTPRESESRPAPRASNDHRDR